MGNLIEELKKIEEFNEQFFSKKEIKRLQKNAINKTIRKISQNSATEISKELQINKRLILRRMYVMLSKASQKNPYALVSIIAYDLPAYLVGTPMQTRNGVKVGKYFFEDAFYHRKSSKIRKVFRRRGKDRNPLLSMNIPVASTISDEFKKQLLVAQRLLIENYRKEIKKSKYGAAFT